MEGLTVGDVAAAARLVFGDPHQPLAGVTTDSREADLRGKLYVALRGARVDGHDFVPEAVAKGAGCLLIEDRALALARKLHAEGKLGAAAVAPDSLKALGDLARGYRSKLGVKIVAITGSAGKTSVKDFVHAILTTTYRTVSAVRSFNNAIGVPMTILRMTPDTQAGVLEIGMNHPGEIDALCRMADPDLVAITTVGAAHLGFFKSLRHVALAKSEILTAGADGIPAFLPADSPFLPLLKRRAARKKVITFGYAASADWRVKPVRSSLKRMEFAVSQHLYRCPNFGEHHLANVALAIGIAAQFAVPAKKIEAAIRSLKLPPGRGEIVRAGPHWIINDSYNANPGSMSAALKRVGTLGRILAARNDRRDVVLVLGDMLELGSKSKYYHVLLGKEARRIRPSRVLFVGKEGPSFRKGFLISGGRGTALTLMESLEDVKTEIQSWMRTERKMLILFKASNQVKLGTVVEAVCQGDRN